MPRYRFDFRDRHCVVHTTALNMIDDSDALDLAQRLAGAHEIAVWEEKRLVATIKRDHEIAYGPAK